MVTPEVVATTLRVVSAGEPHAGSSGPM
jgi:hypothetical protein